MVLSKEEKKAIKSDRTKRAFALTARDIIKSRGVGEVSVRKVADESGYSMGSIYNHFVNLDDLLWLTRDLMIEDLAEYFLNMDLNINSDDDLKSLFRNFMDYFIERPNVFYFFYYHPLDKNQKKTQSNIMNEPKVMEKFAMTFQYIMSKGTFSMEDAGTISSTIIYAMYGMLTLYLSGNDQLTLEQVYEQLDSTVDLLIQ